MSLEFLTALVGCASTTLSVGGAYLGKKYFDKKKKLNNIKKLISHDIFSSINENIIYNQKLYEENKEESIFLKVKYSLILDKIYTLIHNVIFDKEDIDKEYCSAHLTEIINFDINYTDFNTYLKTKSNIADEDKEFFLNIQHFEKIYERMNKIEREIGLKELISTNIDSYDLDRQDIINYLIIFFTFYKNIISIFLKKIYNIHSTHKQKYRRIKNFKNILFEMDKTSKIIYFNPTYSHLIDFLNPKIIGKQYITDLDIFDNEDLIERYLVDERKIKHYTKMKTSLLDNFYSLKVYFKKIDETVFVFVDTTNEMFLNISPSPS